MALLRALHTLKGNSGMLGFAAIRDYVHNVEEVFRAKPSRWPQPLIDRLFEGAALLRRVVEQVGTPDEEAGFARLAALPRPSLSAADASPAPPASAGGAEPATPGATPAGTPAVAAGGAAGGAAGSATDAAPEGTDPAELVVGTELLRVPFEKLDLLANRVAELLVIHAGLADLLGTHREALEAVALRRPLQALAEQTERVAGSLRDAATELRLVPVGRVLRRFPSLARDLARAQGKRIRLEIEGEETLLDKSTVDILGEPLLHLMRNAVDHGIRSPGERRAAGKPEEGTITLRAIPSGDTVVIEVEDDGSGLDRDAIVARARAVGLVAPDEPVSHEEAADLIFRPGFSTRDEASTVSGRGIGMDIVASSVARLRGSLVVEDTPGAGTRFTLRLPLTVAILPVLVFEAASELLALPALDVEEIRRPERVSWVAGAEVAADDDEVIPLARLERLLAWDDGNGARGVPPDPADGAALPRYALIVRRGFRAAAVVADRVLEQRDVLVRALPTYLGQPPGVSGATIAPDGRVILLLDAGGIIDLNLDAHRRTAHVAHAP